MNAIDQLLRTPEFWFVSVFVGVAVNVLSHLLIKAVPTLLERIGGWRSIPLAILIFHSACVLISTLVVTAFGDFVPFARYQPASMLDRASFAFIGCFFALTPFWPRMFLGNTVSRGAELYWLVSLVVAAVVAWFFATADLFFPQLADASLIERMGLLVYSNLMSFTLLLVPVLLGALIFGALSSAFKWLRRAAAGGNG